MSFGPTTKQRVLRLDTRSVLYSKTEIFTGYVNIIN